MMNCEDAANLMCAAVDEELNEQEQHDFFEHLAHCPACAREFDEYRQTKMLVRERIVRIKAPQSLIDSIMQMTGTGTSGTMAT